MRRWMVLGVVVAAMIVGLASAVVAQGYPPTAPDADLGENCNAETGEVGPGEGEYVERDGRLVCESQEGSVEPEGAEPEVSPGGVPTPSRIDTGGGYCGEHVC